MDYAIVLYFDKETEETLQGYAEQVAQACGSRYVADHVRPHVTISALVGEDEPALLETVKQLAEELPQGGCSPGHGGRLCAPGIVCGAGGEWLPAGRLPQGQ